MKTKSFATAFALAGALAIPSVCAGGGGMTGGALEITQIANNVELMGVFGNGLDQIMNQITQIENQLKMLERLSNFNSWEDLIPQINQVIDQMVRAHNGITAVSVTAGNADDRFQQAYPGEYELLAGEGYARAAADIKTLRHRQFSGAQSALSVAGLHIEDMADEGARLNVLRGLSENAIGQQQALQALSQISAMQVEQTQKLRQLQAAQVQMIANAEAAKLQQDVIEEETARDLRRRANSTGPSTPSHQSLWGY
jgi:P-type conjugative transfer protein TrbJ